MRSGVGVEPERVEDVGGRKLSMVDGYGDGSDALVAQREDGVEDVLIGEVGVMGWELVDEKGDEMDIVFGGVTTTGVALEATCNGDEAIFDLPRAPEGVSLGGGKGSYIGRAADVCGRGRRSRVDVERGAERFGVVATVRIHATAAPG